MTGIGFPLTVQTRLKQVARFVRRSLSGLRLFGRGLALVMVAAPFTAGIYIILVIVMNILPVFQVLLMKLLVDRLAVGRGIATHAENAPVALALFYALTLVLPAGIQPIQQELSAWLEDRAVAEVDRRLMHAATRLVDLCKVERPAFQDELRLLQETVYYLPRLFPFLQDGFGSILTLSGILLLLARLHPLVPAVLIAVSVPHLLIARRFHRLVFQAMVKRSRAAREMDYCARIVTEPAAAKEVRAFGLGIFFLHRFRERFDMALSEVRRLRLRELRLSAAFGGLHAFALVGAFWYIVVEARAGRLTLGDIALYLSAVTQTESRVMSLTGSLGRLYETLLHLRPLFTFLDDAGPGIRLETIGKGRPAPTQIRFGIEFRQVHFRYPESTQEVLKIDTLLPAGKVTALVGANGSGKSTTVKLLTRMYDPNDGEILLDGIPLAAYDLSSLRQRIAVLYQDFACFSLTLRENIIVGAGGEEQGDERLEKAARWAGIDEVAARLPQRYETPLTRRFEGGVELSGGEWQKTALARGFMRDASLVILDEPTAALDAEAEYRLFQHFRELVADKTALLISHRLSTVRMADLILVLEDGSIVETGSHAELIARGGRYAALCEMQSERYEDTRQGEDDENQGDDTRGGRTGSPHARNGGGRVGLWQVGGARTSTSAGHADDHTGSITRPCE